MRTRWGFFYFWGFFVLEEKKVKHALTFEQQFSLLRDIRGLIIADEAKAIEKLQVVIITG